MANGTFRDIAGKILLRCSTASLTLAQDWVRSSFRDIIERQRWSWLLVRGQLTVPDEYTTGTATVLAGTQTVTITTGVVSANFIGRQFRIGVSMPIVTITDIDAGLNTLTIDQLWWPDDETAQTYSIYQAYVSVPTDFHAFVSVIDPFNAQPIEYGASVSNIDNTDPQRAYSGAPPRTLAYFDYYNGNPRYELWPHQRSAAVYPMTYESRPIDPFDSGATIPDLLPSDVILERAMMYCAAWPGSALNNPNPYFSKDLIAMHRNEFERRMILLQKQDNEHMQQRLWYQSQQTNNSNIISGSWMQSHALGEP